MRTLRILSIFIGALFLTVQVSAQQTPFLNQYTWNPRLFNPARQGGAEGGEISAIFRNQFLDLDPSDRPSTYLLHVDVSPYLGRRVGLGLQLFGDKVHLLSRFQFSGFFAYHLIQNQHIRFSLGATAGILNQKFDFGGVRVNDVLDLLIFNNQVNARRFDAGPGLAFEYRTANGSFIALDAAASQLFSSDIRIDAPAGVSQKGAVYDMMPHLLANARYRYRGSGFAIEPIATFRALSGARPLQAGLFDFNLNAYFLKDDRLMIGAGMRTNQGGYHLQIGVTPASGVHLIASGEIHAALGLSFEVGASYTLGAPEPPADPLSDAVRNALVDATISLRGLNEEIVTVKSRLVTIGTTINLSEAGTSMHEKASTADQCPNLLAQTARDIAQLGESIRSLDNQHDKAGKMVRDALGQGEKVAPGVRNDLTASKDLLRGIHTQLDELDTLQNRLVEKCTRLRPVINEGNCIRGGDANCVQELFSTKLKAVPGVPPQLFPLQTSLTAGVATVIYHFPDDDESYLLVPAFRTLASHIAGEIDAVKQQNVRLEQLALVTELQEDKNTLDYSPGLTYNGEFGSNLPTYTLIDNETGQIQVKTLAVGQNDQVTLEGLALLKLTALRKFLIEQGMPAEAIVLQIRFNHTSNIYREETKAVVKLRG